MTLALVGMLAVTLPGLLQWAAKHYRWIDRIGVVTCCYLAGIIFGNLPAVHVPEKEVRDIFLGPLVALSIPLLLFSSDFGIWRKMGKRLLLSFACCVFAVSLAVIAGTMIFQSRIDDAWILGSMLMGVYTGGTLNLNAIGYALGIDAESLAVLNTTEMLFGAMWLLALLTIARPLLGKVLRAPAQNVRELNFTLDERIYLKTSTLALLLSAGIIALAAGLSLLLLRRQEERLMLLTITALGIAVSAIPAVRRMKGSFGLGNYLLLMFCVAVGSLADVGKILDAAPAIIAFVAFVMFSAIAIHLLLSIVLRMDADTFILASAASIFGPPFIAPVAKATGNVESIPVGLALALLGLAIGNICGIGISGLLEQL
jgi:uncharacterized membrane protein